MTQNVLEVAFSYQKAMYMWLEKYLFYFDSYYRSNHSFLLHKTISISILYRYWASFTAKYTNHDNCIFANLTYEESKENRRFNIYYKYILKKSSKGKVIMRDPHLSNPCGILSFR